MSCSFCSCFKRAQKSEPELAECGRECTCKLRQPALTGQAGSSILFCTPFPLCLFEHIGLVRETSSRVHRPGPGERLRQGLMP